MVSQVKPGYMGQATVGGLQIRCTSFSVNPQQDVLFYNHVIGLKDTVPADSATKGENLGATYANTQRRIWRPSPIAITGGMAFPATKDNVYSIFTNARYANYFDLEFIYYCPSGTFASEGSRTFNDCRINSYDFTVQAGDILNINMDVAAKKVEDGTGFINNQNADKLVTWDKCKVTITNAPFTVDGLLVSGVNFKINNNIQTIYVTGDIPSPVGTNPLLPYDLRVGMQEVSGTVSVYLDHGYRYIPITISNVSNIRIDLPDGNNITMDVVFKSHQLEGQVGPVITQLPFVGVDKVFA